MFAKLQSFTIQCARVLSITRKPTKEEWKTIVKMSGIGITIIGMLGFLITYFRELLFK